MKTTTLVGLILLCSTGCASHSVPAGPPPVAEAVLPSLVSEAATELDAVCRRLIPEHDGNARLLVLRSPRPDEEKAGPHDARVRTELARALRNDPVLASRCDITAVTPAESAAFDTRADWKKSISITGEVDPAALPRTYFPACVWVGRVHFEQVSSGSGQVYRLEVTIWSPQKRTWEFAESFIEEFFPNGQGKWVRAPARPR